MDSPLSDPKANAAFALHRFGFGPRAGSIAAIAADPRGALLAELSRPAAGRLTDGDLLTGAEAARAAFDFRQERKATRLVEQAKREAAKAAAASPGAARPDGAPKEGAPKPDGAAKSANPPDGNKTMADTAAPKPNPQPAVPQQIFREEAKARIDAALNAEIGFCERLTWFWSNHFCVSADKGGVRPLVGAYEREAIRPHILGRFGDMLLAVETHPAMLLYLDNARSIGPDSEAGRNRGKGLNENLAREILELHTLGVRTVYTQDDVTRFAKVITGWSIVPPKDANGGEFRFDPRMHEPGPQTVIGKVYGDETFEQGRAVLATLARHPVTARHIATKLVRHFVSDQPLPTLADKLTKRFIETEGNLREVTKTLVMAPESWDPANRKLKRPGEWIVASLRATGVTPPDINPVMQAQNLLGEPLWRPSAPVGFSDDDAAWLDGVAQRLDIANQMARRVAGMVDPDAAVEASLGPLASEDTKTAIRRAESRPQALTMLFMAPEFQRR
jgi:uncharacterized protein (DUF1800 family)